MPASGCALEVTHDMAAACWGRSADLRGLPARKRSLLLHEPVVVIPRADLAEAFGSRWPPNSLGTQLSFIHGRTRPALPTSKREVGQLCPSTPCRPARGESPRALH